MWFKSTTSDKISRIRVLEDTHRSHKPNEGRFDSCICNQYVLSRIGASEGSHDPEENGENK